MVRHNNVIPNQHFKKKWHQVIGVRTWFNQPARKLRRRNGKPKLYRASSGHRSRDGCAFRYNKRKLFALFNKVDLALY